MTANQCSPVTVTSDASFYAAYSMNVVAMNLEAVYLCPPPHYTAEECVMLATMAQVLLGVGSTRAVAAVFSWMRRTPGMQVRSHWP